MDYNGLAIFAALSALVALLGIVVDRFMYEDERDALSEVLLRWWVMVDETRVPDLPRRTCEVILAITERLVGRSRRSIRFATISVLVSACLTATALIIGDSIWSGGFVGGWTYFSNNPRWALYPANFLFDLATVLLTLWLVGLMVRVGDASRLGLILFDASLALVLAATMFCVSQSVEFWGDSAAPFGPDGIRPEFLKAALQAYWTYWDLVGVISWDWSLGKELASITEGWVGPHPFIIQSTNWGLLASFLSANTTFIPTLIILLLFVLLIASLTVTRVVRLIALRVLRLDVETEKSVFFYSGTLIGFLATATKTIIEVTKLTFA